MEPHQSPRMINYGRKIYGMSQWIMSLFSEELESFEETGVAPEEPSASCQGDLTVDQCELQAAELRATNAEQRCAPGLRASPEPCGGRMLKMERKYVEQKYEHAKVSGSWFCLR